ncbi:MAG: RNA-binding transcriptional accessory protein [Spirochaetae bacterium HGW-Spirochaetae-1]|nr:MAG: RNA-binding transcriptional accessory protein [Spirochaetae bacterium HGW-Spirochaetae-1]
MEQSLILQTIALELSLKVNQAEAVVALSTEGCTIPFIARYRKEKTGGLDEVAISAILESFERHTELEKRREYILQYLTGQDKLTPELDTRIRKALTMAELEDIYLPYKPRKKTLADRAIELGMEPLADLIVEKNPSLDRVLALAAEFTGGDVAEPGIALEHAMNILTQRVSDNADVRRIVRVDLQKGSVRAAVKRGKKEEGQKYRDYFDFSEKAQHMASHRIMAVLRGGKEGILNVSLESAVGTEQLAGTVMTACFGKRGEVLLKSATESLERHLLSSMGNEILKELREKAERESLEIFARNLEKILLAAPFGERAVIGIDPGIRTGCKAAVIDKNGVYRDFLTMQLNGNPSEAGKILPWLATYGVEGIAVGSGTFGRETWSMIRDLLGERGVVAALVDEDGASVYSASETAREEFPGLDVTVKGAISIGRRFQDPLAELVKIDPRSLGVGQYQHDITASLLETKLRQTVEWAVNRVGVNLNTAGYHLLAFVSGLDKNRAREIVKYRTESGRIRSRKELKKIKGIGDKAFQQCAGFLRIMDGDNSIERTGVHPESYDDVEKIAHYYGKSVVELVAGPEIMNKDDIKKQLHITEAEAVMGELLSRGLDPRKEYTPVSFDEKLKSIDDIGDGMILHGIVDNVTAFGAFVDVGIKDKGLVHISEISVEYVKDINKVLSVGDRVLVKVIAVDRERGRISLSMRRAAER